MNVAALRAVALARLSKQRALYTALRKQGYLPGSLAVLWGLGPTVSGVAIQSRAVLECYLTDAERPVDLSADVEANALLYIWLALPTQEDKVLFLERHTDKLLAAFGSFHQEEDPQWVLHVISTRMLLDARSLPLLRRLLIHGNALMDYPAVWFAWAMESGSAHLLPAHGLVVTPALLVEANTQFETYRGAAPHDDLDMDHVLQEYAFARQNPPMFLVGRLLLHLKRSPTWDEWNTLQGAHPQVLTWRARLALLIQITPATDPRLVEHWLQSIVATANAGAGAHATFSPRFELHIWALHRARIAPEVIATFLQQMPGAAAHLDSYYRQPLLVIKDLHAFYPTTIMPTLFQHAVPARALMDQWLATARSKADRYREPVLRAISLYVKRLIHETYPPGQPEAMETSSSCAKRDRTVRIMK
jgi:hypothetical protein